LWRRNKGVILNLPKGLSDFAGIVPQILGRRFAGYFFKHTVKADSAAKADIIGNGGYAVELARKDFPAGFIDPYLAEKDDICFTRVLFKVPAKGLRRKMRYFGHLPQLYVFGVMHHRILVHIVHPKSFYIRIRITGRKAGQRLPFFYFSQGLQQADKARQPEALLLPLDFR